MRTRFVAIVGGLAGILVLAAAAASGSGGKTSAVESLTPPKTVSVNEALERLKPHLEHLERALNDTLGTLIERRLAVAMRRQGLSDSAQAVLMRRGDWAVGPFVGGSGARIAHDFYLRNLGPLRQMRDGWRSKYATTSVPEAEIESVEAQMAAFYRAEPSVLALVEQGFVIDAQRAALGWKVRSDEDTNHLGSVDGLGDPSPGFIIINPYLDASLDSPPSKDTGPLRARLSALSADASALERRYQAMHPQFTLPPGEPAPRLPAASQPDEPSNDRLRE